MIVFKTTCQIVKKYKITILLYTILLVLFTAMNFQTNESTATFEVVKPDVLIINNDKNIGVTKNLITYINQKCNVKEIENDEEKISDALFYRDVSYIIYIPNNYREDFLNGKNPKIDIKKTGDYESSLAEMLLNKYLDIASIYQSKVNDEEKLIDMINETLIQKTNTEITSSLDTNSLAKATFYFNFLNYSILAGCVYTLCLILSSFKKKSINKRTVISSMNYKVFNNKLLLSTFLVAIVMWIFYILLSFILVGKVMFTMNGLLYIANSFIFTICALSISLLIGNLVNDKNAINGIINVVALGSSFICGAFVSMELLPESLLKFAHILPSYWYIKTNEMIGSLEEYSLISIKPLLINMGVLVLFIILFIIIINLVTKKKMKMKE